MLVNSYCIACVLVVQCVWYPMADVFQQKNVLHCSTFLSGNTTNVQMSRSMEAIMNTACVTVFAQKVCVGIGFKIKASFGSFLVD